MQRGFLGMDGFVWWKGVVEDRKDPLFLGRAKVRIHGWHTADKNEMPTESLPWAHPIIPFDAGKNVVGAKEGDWIVGFFADGVQAQHPIMMGVLPGIPEDPANPSLGFYDPTPPSELVPTEVPRPPEMSGLPDTKSLSSFMPLMETLGNLGDKISELTTSELEQINELGKTFNIVASAKNLPNVSTIISDLTATINSILPGARTGDEDAIPISPSDLLNNVTKVKNVFSNIPLEDLASLQTVGQQIQNLSNLSKLKNISEIVDGIGNFKIENLNDVARLASEFTNIDITKVPKEAIDKLTSQISNFTDFSQIADVVGQFQGTINNLSNIAQLSNISSLANFSQIFSGANSEVISQIGSTLSNIGKLAGINDISGIVTQLANLKNVGEDAVNVIKNLGNNLTDFADLKNLTNLPTALLSLTGTQLPLLSSLSSLTKLSALISNTGDFTIEKLAQDILDEFTGEVGEVLDRFSDPNKLPGVTTAFGELTKDFVPTDYKFDVNNDGVYDQTDANIIAFGKNTSEPIDPHENKFLGGDFEVSYPISPYPLEPYLKEPWSSRLARGEDSGKIEETIVGKKKSDLGTGETASHESTGVGTDAPMGGESFLEPASPYDAKYPYNHVYESESGHITEIDDTPGFERMHWYHRAGTFREIHPDGQTVDKIKKKHFHFIEEDFFMSAGLSANLTAGKQLRLKSGEEMNVATGGDLNRDVDGKLNTLVKEDTNTKIEKNSYTVIKGDLRLLVEGNIFIASEGDVKIKAKGDFLVDAANIKTNAESQNVIAAGAAVVTEGPVTFCNTAITDGIFIHAKVADSAKAAEGVGLVPDIPSYIMPDAFEKENDADNKDNLVTAASEPKEGFVWDGPDGDLYKPAADSDGKAVVLTDKLGQPVGFYEAIPTGTLENVTIEYKHKDGSITSWQVVRPIHIPGNLIEMGRYSGNGNGGRDHWRFSKPGSEYPENMIVKIGNVQEWLILSSAIRHD